MSRVLASNAKFNWKITLENGELHSKPVLGVIRGKDKMWILKKGGPLIQVHLHYILVQGTQKRRLLKAGDPLI